MLAESTKETALIDHLLIADAYSHAVEEIQLLETHISWVILTGEFAYKIKKPVNLGFVDYSSLEKRKNYCDLEVQLNRRFAGEMYLGVVPIVVEKGEYKVCDETELQDHADSAVEFAVKMQQFPQDAIVAARLQNQGLSADAVEEFGRYLADFHGKIESAIPTILCVQPECITKDALDNFVVVQAEIRDKKRLSRLEKLERWTTEQAAILTFEFSKRLNRGYVRRCHGDLHLKNIVQLNGKLQAFDGIEFNEEFQWIDLLSEVAFPVMDFVARGRGDLAWRLLNSYLEETGDYVDMKVLRFYLVYRAMVRAKVTCLNPKNKLGDVQTGYASDDEIEDAYAGPWDKYLDTAEYFAFELKPKLAITHGFSGSGKSTVAIQAIEKEGGIRIRSDVERNRLAEKTQSSQKFSTAMSDWVYSHLFKLSKCVLNAGFAAIIDATFLSESRRSPILNWAVEYNVPFEILDCEAPNEELVERIRNRGPDPSEATEEVLRNQLASHDPLSMDELVYVKRHGT